MFLALEVTEEAYFRLFRFLELEDSVLGALVRGGYVAITMGCVWGSLKLVDFNLTKVMEYGAYLDKKYTSDKMVYHIAVSNWHFPTK